MTLGLAVSLQEVSAAVMAVGACIAIIGALVVFRKWSSGEQHVERYVMAWIGGVLALVIIQIIILGMFR